MIGGYAKISVNRNGSVTYATQTPTRRVIMTNSIQSRAVPQTLAILDKDTKTYFIHGNGCPLHKNCLTCPYSPDCKYPLGSSVSAKRAAIRLWGNNK